MVAEPPVRTFGATPLNYRLSCFFWIQSIDFSHGYIFGRINALNIDFIGIVRYTIHDCIGKGTFATTDLLIPFLFPELGAKDCRKSFPSFMYQFKQVSGLRFGQLQEKPFIDDQQNWLGIFFKDSRKVPVVTSRL